MCVSPLQIVDHGVYSSPYVSPFGYDVPCGKCVECRSMVRNEWKTRLSFELSALYARGGIAVFLTFTYNTACLPVIKQLHQPAFNRDDVSRFLNVLKVNAWRKFGKGSYKYFFVSEYGKNTKRPHYHGLFMLQDSSKWMEFVELARSLWTYGFMFPKVDKYGHYVDDKGCLDSPCIRSLLKGAVYVSKYITKDMSFYDLPCISKYLADYKRSLLNPDKTKHLPNIDNYLPKHWQSKGLGSLILRGVPESDYSDIIVRGVWNPLSMKREALPSYLVNRLMYKNVKSNRVSQVSGKPLYDRVLTEFGRKYMYISYCDRVQKVSSKIRDFLSATHDVSAVVDKVLRLGRSLSPTLLANVHLFLKYHKPYQFADIYLQNEDLISTFSTEKCAQMYVDCHDVEYLKGLKKLDFINPNVDVWNVSRALGYHLELAKHVVSAWRLIRARDNLNYGLYKDKLDDMSDKFKRFFSRYNINLC